MSEWIEYTGSDEQIAEIRACVNDVLCRYKDGTERFKSDMFTGDWKHLWLTHYLICNPRPLADMICQQARTGQPVWEKFNKELDIDDKKALALFLKTNEIYPEGIKTLRPDWNNTLKVFSFTPFEELNK